MVSPEGVGFLAEDARADRANRYEFRMTDKPSNGPDPPTPPLLSHAILAICADMVDGLKSWKVTIAIVNNRLET